MKETSARLLRLLTLLQTRREWSGADLAGRLGISTRTLRRDVDKLRDLDYPIHAGMGPGGGYRLGAGAALPPLLLDDDEAVAVAVGLRTAAGGTLTGIEEASVRALAKLEQVLPSRLRHRVSALHSVTLPLPGAGPPVAQSTSWTVCSTGMRVPAAICVIQPIFPAAITSGSSNLIFATLRSRNLVASCGCRML